MSKKARKNAGSQAEPSAEVVSLAVTELEENPERRFFFLPDVEMTPADERDLHILMKWWRHGRATKTIWQALTDGYVVVFTAIVIAAMLASVILSAQSNQAEMQDAVSLIAKSLLPTATGLACYALSLSVAHLFGPILASAAEGFWLMEAPVSRQRLLRGRLGMPVILAGVISLLLTGLVGAVSGLTWAQVAIWGVAAGIGAAAMMAIAGAEQPSERKLLTNTLQTVAAVAALAILALVVAVAAGWLAVNVPPAETWAIVEIGLAGVLLVVLVVMWLLAIRRLDSIRRSRLLSGGSLISGMQGAMFALDFGLIRDILVERKAQEKGHVRPTRGRGLGLKALVWRDVERLFRDPRPFIPLLLTLFVPYAMDALGMGQLNPFLSALALMFAIVPFFGSLRVLSRTGGLARSFPFPTTQLRTALMIVPICLAMIWGTLAFPAFAGISSADGAWNIPDAALTVFCVAAGGVLGAVRWVSAKKVDFAAPMMATQTGAVPPSLIVNLVRGFDVIALITAPLILNWGTTWSVVIAVAVFAFVRGTFSMDDMQAQANAAKKNLAAEKKLAEKKRIPRPTPKR